MDPVFNVMCLDKPALAVPIPATARFVERTPGNSELSFCIRADQWDKYLGNGWSGLQYPRYTCMVNFRPMKILSVSEVPVISTGSVLYQPDRVHWQACYMWLPSCILLAWIKWAPVLTGWFDLIDQFIDKQTEGRSKHRNGNRSCGRCMVANGTES